MDLMADLLCNREVTLTFNNVHGVSLDIKDVFKCPQLCMLQLYFKTLQPLAV